MTGTRPTLTYGEHYSTNQNTEIQREYDRRKLRESRRQSQLNARKKGLAETPGSTKSKSIKTKKRGRITKSMKKPKIKGKKK